MRHAILLCSFLLLGSCEFAPRTRVATDGVSIVGGASPSALDPIAAVAVKVETMPAATPANANTILVFTCSGTLVSPRFVLTAAHCFGSDRVIRQIVFYDGAIARTKRVFVHPQFDRTRTGERFDFALVELEARRSSEVAMLPAPDFTLSDGTDVEVAGYGVMDLYGETASRTLQALPARIDIYDHSAGEALVNTPALTGPCLGDSGGPGYLVRGGRILLWGVDLGGYESPEGVRATTCGNGEIYSKVTAALPWIRSVIGSANSQ